MIITMISYFRLSSISLLLSLSLSSSLSLTFSLLFEILPVLFKPQVRCALVPVGSQEHGRQRGHLMNVLPPSILIHLHAMVRSYTCNCSIRVAVKINYSYFMWVIFTPSSNPCNNFHLTERMS